LETIVLTKIKGPNQHEHFNPYYKNNPVLIQFVITEFVTTHQLVCQIKRLSIKDLQSTLALEECIQSLFQYVNQLLGSAVNHEHPAISRWTKGPLTKLKNYCEQFSKNTQNQNKCHLDLYNYVHQAWLSAVENLELLNILQESLTIPFPQSAFIATKRALNQLDTRLNHIAKQIPRVLSAYKDNENVLFFLLRKKEHLSEIYGSDFISKIFKCFSRKSTQLIVQRYLERGFAHLLPAIHQTSSKQESICV
jgi:hypothetical protein